MVYKGTNKTFDFRNFETIRVFGNEIRNNITSLETANVEQASLLSNVHNFMKKNKTKGSWTKKNLI